MKQLNIEIPGRKSLFFYELPSGDIEVRIGACDKVHEPGGGMKELQVLVIPKDRRELLASLLKG